MLTSTNNTNYVTRFEFMISGMEICVMTCWLLMLQTRKQWRAIARSSRGSELGKADTSGHIAAHDGTEKPAFACIYHLRVKAECFGE